MASHIAMLGKAPAVKGRGKLAERGEKLEFSPIRSASLGEPNCSLSFHPCPGTCLSPPKICLF